MPDIKQDVNPASSNGNGVKVESPPTDELAKTKADNDRLKGALSSLQSERDEIRTELEELRQIKAQWGELTARQEAERQRLERREGTIEDKIDSWKKQILRQNPDAENWFTDVELKLAKATKTASDLGANQASLERAADLLEELADELTESEEFKDITDEKLLKLIKPFMGQFETKSPYLKTKKAFKAWKADHSERKQRSEEKKKKSEESLTAENGGRLPRETSTQEIFNKKNLESSDKATLRDRLGIMQRPR